MTTKKLPGSYPEGYTLNTNYGTVVVTGEVGGSGLVTPGYALVRNKGELDSDTEHAALSMYGGGRFVNSGDILGAYGSNGVGVLATKALSGVSVDSSDIRGGDGYSFGTQGGVGGTGGIGVELSGGGNVDIRAREGGYAIVSGGAGGADTAYNGAGGDGGAGIVLGGVGTITIGSASRGARILGGDGGDGDQRAWGGGGGDGGDGVVLEDGGQVIVGRMGVVSAGSGGTAYYFVGAGGTGVFLKASGTVANAGTIEGGDTTRGYYQEVFYTGDAVRLLGGGAVTNTGEIVGGKGGVDRVNENYGDAGIALSGGGTISNSGTVLGGADGNGAGVMFRGAGSISNSGTIVGGAGGGFEYNAGAGVKMLSGDTLFNSGSIVGGFGGNYMSGDGVYLAGGAIFNMGTIRGGAFSGKASQYYSNGIIDVYDSRYTSSLIVNGSKRDTSALIVGGANGQMNGYGVLTGGRGATVINYGTITGQGADAVRFLTGRLKPDYEDVLVAEAGSAFLGGVYGGGGLLELGQGQGTISGVDAGGNVTVSGFLFATTTFDAFGSVELLKGASFAAADGATIDAGESLIDKGSLTIGSNLIDAGAMTVGGALSGAGTVSVSGKFTLSQGATLAVAGVAVTAGAQVIVDTDVVFGDVWTQTSGRLTIDAGGSLDFTGGSNSIHATGLTNDGVLEVSGGAGLLSVQTPLVNDGALVVNGGTLALATSAAVTGTGSAQISGGTLQTGQVFDQAVTFGGDGGTLVLIDSQAYTATVSGFADAGGTSLDLRDIGFVDAGEATFSGTKTSGILTVSDGTHTARIALAGDYRNATFVAASDGAGGVDVVATGSQIPSAARFVSVMAAMTGHDVAAGLIDARRGNDGRQMMLTAPRLALA